jgi:hypothetical protein
VLQDRHVVRLACMLKGLPCGVLYVCRVARDLGGSKFWWTYPYVHDQGTQTAAMKGKHVGALPCSLLLLCDVIVQCQLILHDSSRPAKS